MDTSRKTDGIEGLLIPGSPGGAREAKSRLLKAAILLFAKQGHEGVGIREIAGVAGQNSSLISYHFGGKEGIHQAAVSLACRQVERLVDAFPAPPETETLVLAAARPRADYMNHCIQAIRPDLDARSAL